MVINGRSQEKGEKVLAALRQPAQVQQCLELLRQDVRGISEADGAFVLLP